MIKKNSTVIIGGGASGIVAAISAKRNGQSVVICERLSVLGKKISASGAGRCNLLNEDLNESYYNPSSRNLVKSVFTRFSKEDIKKFFDDLGLKLRSEGKRVYPITDQSSSVLKVLDIELKRLPIPVEFNFDVADISQGKEGFIISSRTGKKIECSKLIIAGGGKSYPALGSDGSCYKLAKGLGHSIIEPVPVAVPIVVKDAFCHFLQGQKVMVNVKSIIDGKITSQSLGDLLFTKYGLSGTAILDISCDISIAINRLQKNNIFVSVDLAPFMTKETLKGELDKRIKKIFAPDDLLTGILPNKFCLPLKDILRSVDAEKIAGIVKEKCFKVSGTRGWNEAEFTNGGIPIDEVKEGTLESKVKKGLYFAGEILDVDGRRGGYNLAWAWASGFVAGLGE